MFVEETSQFGRMLRLNAFARIEPKNPVSGHESQAVVPCRGEVVFPGRAVDRSAKLGGQFRRPVRGSGVQDHDFIGDFADAFDRFGQHLLLVADDHRYGEAGPRQRFCEDFHMPSLAIPRFANQSIVVRRQGQKRLNSFAPLKTVP